MKYIDNGNGRIPLISLIAILSISLTVNLPGLAVTPVMGKLKEVFPHVSELEVQLLTSLPNLVIIPVILLAGRLATRHSKTVILAIGLVTFLVAGVLCFFADSMLWLIVLGCLVGIGCGFLIPLAASMLSIYFDGQQRADALGMKSGTSNGAVIVATLFVGWVASGNWHAAFAVYLIPVVPLALLPFMTKKFIDSHHIAPTADEVAKAKADDEKDKPQTHHADGSPITKRDRLRILAGIIGVYICITYCASVMFYCLPFTMAHYGLGTGEVGVATAMFYTSAMVFGFVLPYYTKVFKRVTVQSAIAITLAGIVLVTVFHSIGTYVAGVFLVGVGYGIVQPMIYDKTTALAPTKQLSTQWFAYVLTGNYIAIACVPFFVKLVATIFGTTTEADPDFAFWLDTVIGAGLLAVALLCRKSYPFTTNPKYYTKNS